VSEYWVALASAKYYLEACPLLRPRRHRDMCSGPRKGNISFISATTAIYVLEGNGIVMLNDARHSFQKGGTIFIPKNTWHGFANPEYELLLLWIMSPAGLDGFFRETCSPPGVPPKQLTRQQVNEIALKYATEFR